jgi:Cu(I)/Ag(I) efflux system membrane fusion protein
MRKSFVYAAVALLLLAVAGISLYPRLFPAHDASPDHAAAPPGSEASYYTCPMHPSVRSDRPAACPICGMALVRRSSGPAPESADAGDLGPVTLSPSQQVLANVSVVPVGRGKLRREIPAVGRIEYAEPNLSHITLRYPGRIERLHVTFTGEHVAKGSAVAEVYSPEAISAQKEYLLSLEAAELTKDAYEDIAAGSEALLAQSRQKLQRWGFSDDQIESLASTRSVADNLTIFAPASGTVLKKYVEPQQYLAAGSTLFDIADLTQMWLIADVYEVDLAWVRPGVSVSASSEAFPGERFTGAVRFVEPSLDPGTRTARARINLANPFGKLKAGMFLQVVITVELPSSLLVPASAVLSTGQKSVVWMDAGNGVFRPRTVLAGARSGNLLQILKGLEEGEAVVASGGYLLDSESQLQMTTAPAHTHEEKRP